VQAELAGRGHIRASVQAELAGRGHIRASGLRRLSRCGGNVFALKPGSTFCVCKPNSLGATLNQDLKRKFRLGRKRRWSGR